MPGPPPTPRAVAPESPGWAEVPFRRLRDGAPRTEVDRLAIEAPLEIRFGDRPFTVLMRTPGSDEELVAGFLYSEGLIRDAAEIVALGHPEALLEGDCENVITVELAGGGEGVPRTFYASASCGVCGKSSIADLAIRAPVVESDLRIDRRVLEALPERLRSEQSIFAETGGLHGAALFDAAGTLLAAREDIGRHNAVDKLIGWALARRRLPLSAAVLMVSGRLGFEIVQKSIVAGLPVLASVGAASSIAVGLAERYGVTLATFVRPGNLNLYGRPDRVA
ncbi:MAG: formate dehydrogenase accessory sulfurtransferase FdhD [Thermoanaerobaculia bacterium]